MPQLKIFVSSTCYDLGMVRAELRSFLINLGHEPVMSEYNDILFDPKDHTHESCIKEIPNSDALVLIIGSRFGGKALPQALNLLDLEKMKNLSKSTKILDKTDNISITQLEVLKAIDANIPIFTFVDSRVLHDHLFYEKNKHKGIIENIEFPSIDKKESAVYIFEFINFLRLRSKNNSITEFGKVSDIEMFLKRQWSSLLQRLLSEQRNAKNEMKRIEDFSEELKDIKSLILTSITSNQAKEIGRGVIKFRRLIDFLLSLNHPNVKTILARNIEWNELLEALDIKEVKILDYTSRSRPTILFVKDDNTFYLYSYPVNIVPKISLEWNNFRELSEPVKVEIINAVAENGQNILRYLQYKKTNVDDYIEDLKEKLEATSTTLSTTTLGEHSRDNDDEDGTEYSAIVNDRQL